jgi:hypothetical protein
MFFFAAAAADAQQVANMNSVNTNRDVAGLEIAALLRRQT